MSDRRRRAGFSFVEILVVMGIIAVLVGLGIGVFNLISRKAPITKTRALLGKMKANVDTFRLRYKSNPPALLSVLPSRIDSASRRKIGKPTPPNTNNEGIETVFQALSTPGFGHNPDLDEHRSNTDGDALDAAWDSKSGDATLHEVMDAWENPLVYFPEGEYATADKNPPTYVNKKGEAFNPKPWRISEGGPFAQANGYQIFSIGEDGEPNTEDDLKHWTSD